MLEQEIRKHLIQYLAGKISLDEFKHWFVPNTWDIHLADESAAAALAYEIDHRLNEHSSEHLLEPQLRRELSELLSHATISFGSVPVTTITNSSRWQHILTPSFTFAETEDRFQSFGTLSVVALV